MGKALHNVRQLYMEGIAGGNAREAVERYTGHRYTQHSTGVADGAEGFLAFFEPFIERNPIRDIKIVRIFEDGPWVFCSAYQSLNNGAAEWVTMDLFYTDPEGLILEHWDTIAPYQAQTVSGEDMVAGTSVVDTTADSVANKKIVLEFSKQVLQENCHSKLELFVAPQLIQHSASIAANLSGLSEWLQSDDAGSFDTLFQIAGQGNFVMTYSKRHVRSDDLAVFDVYRVEDNKIVEHWQNSEVISARENWGNSGKF